jgi:hypothetical protein
MDKYGTLFSQLFRSVVYLLQRPMMQVEKGMLIISVDVDVGSKELGIINGGKNDVNVSSSYSEYLIGKVEEQALPLFIDLFNHYEIPVTFALRGQLTEVCNSVFDLFLESSVKHDIGAHGYYHKDFRNLSQNEARNELKMISTGMKRLGIIPKSFVFPRNNVAHLDLLGNYGYKCYRDRRLCTYIEKEGRLYNVHPSLFIYQYNSPKLLKRFIDLCTAKKVPFHVWFHPWNFGFNEKLIRRNIKRLFFPVIEYAQQKVKRGELTFETMLSAAQKIEEFRHN